MFSVYVKIIKILSKTENCLQVVPLPLGQVNNWTTDKQAKRKEFYKTYVGHNGPLVVRGISASGYTGVYI